MRAPSVKALTAAFRDLTPEKARLIRALARAVDEGGLENLIETRPELEATRKYVHSLYHSPYDSLMWRVTVALDGINTVIGGYGVEALGPDVGGPRPPPYEYINMGDTYTTTLVYKRATNNLFIGSWGDIVERYGRSWR
jgi:hypothetical protein